MGTRRAMEAATVMTEMVGVEKALEYHLQSNHFPPVPVSMVPVCLAAIDAFVEEDFARLIELPEGIEFRGSSEAPAHAIVEAHHLGPFIEVRL